MKKLIFASLLAIVKCKDGLSSSHLKTTIPKDMHVLNKFDGMWSEIEQVRSDINNSTSCGSCVWTVTKDVMEFAFGKAEEFCAHHEHLHACRWMAKEPAMVVGYLAHQIRPMSLAASACFGAEKCLSESSTDVENLILDQDIDENDQKYLIAHPALHKHMDHHHMKHSSVDHFHHDDDLETDSHHSFDDEDEPCDCRHEEHDEEDGLDCPCKIHKCKRCIHVAMSKIIRMAVGKAQRFCRDETPCCKAAELMCHWAETHPKIAIGFLIGEVEPWKGAMGYCVGNRMCHIPHHPMVHAEHQMHGNVHMFDEHVEEQFTPLEEHAHEDEQERRPHRSSNIGRSRRHRHDEVAQEFTS